MAAAVVAEAAAAALQALGVRCAEGNLTSEEDRRERERAREGCSVSGVALAKYVDKCNDEIMFVCVGGCVGVVRES